MFENGLFVFHRDYRIHDNTALNHALSNCRNVFCCFIFNPEQVGNQNKYKSKNAIQFMIESLDDLRGEIESKGGKLITCYGDYVKMIDMLIKKLNIHAIFFNKDYTPYALSRQGLAGDLCEKHGIPLFSCLGDYYLYEPGTIVTGQSNGFKKYTPFYNEVVNQSVRPPSNKRNIRISSPSSSVSIEDKITLDEAKDRFVGHENENILVRGGRTEGLLRLKNAAKTQESYETERDTLTYNTTFLSAYIKFGCVSIREVYHTFARAFGKKSGIIRELIWRDFFAHVLFHYPEVMNQSYQPRYRSLKWRKSESDFDAWKSGNTGFPVVDAGMRQLNQTGYMHNRVRMIVASFLVKVLLLDWRLGERYFAEKLTDYDIASNNGNWQGISGTGVDMKPYFRDMNPWIQSAKFDKNAEYVKKWIPELEPVSPRDIHLWFEKHENYSSVSYPKPMVDYYEQKKKMLEMYSNA